MAGHENLGAEAKALLDVLSEKIKAGPDHDAARCTGCPICAAMTYLKDHRELSHQLAQGALLIVGALRQYLDHPSPSATSQPPSASVQHIDIS